jgi:putative ABC transport system substrate-binding protein
MFVANRQQILTAITRIRLPAIFRSTDDTDAGGLISYGPNYSEGFRSAAGYVARILKGERPANMPFEQPTKFELAVNLKAAKAIGITIPQTILLRADKVIE